MLNLQKAAEKVSRLKVKMSLIEEKLKEAKTTLIDLVGDGGEKIETENGIVTVTVRTETRSSNKVVYKFDLEAFLKLDEHIQANLIKNGVVSKDIGIIQGQAPTVRVS